MSRLAAPLPAVVIRPLGEADLPSLEWEGEYTRYRRIFRTAYADMLAGSRILLVAGADAAVVGRLFIQLDSSDRRYADGVRRAYLYALHVRTQWQRRGIGTRLVGAAEAALCARGFGTAVIAVGKVNLPALRLYQRLRYVIFDEDPGLWSFADDQDQVHNEIEPSWMLEKPLRCPEVA